MLIVTHTDGFFSHFIHKVFFAVAGAVWLFISTLNFNNRRALQEEMEQSGFGAELEGHSGKRNYLAEVGNGFLAFLEGIWVGGKLVFTNRRFICKFLSSSAFSASEICSGLFPA